MNRVFSCFIVASCLYPVVFDSSLAAQEKKAQEKKAQESRTPDKIGELRFWNDTRGHEITARFLRYREGMVYLRAITRQTHRVKPNELSKKDQDYIIKRLRENKKEKDAEEFEKLTKVAQTFGENRGGSNSGNASSSAGLASPPGAGNGLFRGGNGRFNAGAGRTPRGAPGSRPPQKTPAGDAPVMFGGDPDRTPSPYARTPDSERMELDSNPSGRAEKDGAGTPRGAGNPFAESGRPDTANGLPSSSPGESNGNGSEIKSKVENPGIDPFAESEPVKSKSPKSNEAYTNNAFEREQPTEYRPPTLPNKADNTTSKVTLVPVEKVNPGGADSQTNSHHTGGKLVPDIDEPSSTGRSNQTMILVAIGVMSILILIMIALLVVVLVKSRTPKPRRSYF